MTPPESPESRSVQRRKAIQRGEPRPESPESPAERLKAEIRPFCEHGERAACRFCQKEHIAWLRQAVTRLEAEVTRLTQQREEAERDTRQRIEEIAKLTSEVFHERDKVEVMAKRADRYLARAEAADAALTEAQQVADASHALAQHNFAVACERERERDAAREEAKAYGISFGRLEGESAQQHVEAIKACYDAQHAKALKDATRAALLQAAEDVRGLSNWIRTHGNINSDDAIDECARAVANVASQLTARAKESGE
jgi:hypothetical protein